MIFLVAAAEAWLVPEQWNAPCPADAYRNDKFGMPPIRGAAVSLPHRAPTRLWRNPSPSSPYHLFKHPLSVLSPRHGLHTAARSALTLPWSRKGDGLEETSVRAQGQKHGQGVLVTHKGQLGPYCWNGSALTFLFATFSPAQHFLFLSSSLLYFSWAVWEWQTKLLYQKDITASKVEFCLSGTALYCLDRSTVQHRCSTFYQGVANTSLKGAWRYDILPSKCSQSQRTLFPSS